MYVNIIIIIIKLFIYKRQPGDAICKLTMTMNMQFGDDWLAITVRINEKVMVYKVNFSSYKNV